MVTIWSKTNCSSCTQAKLVLQARGVEFEYKVLGQDYDMEDLMEELERVGMLGFRTFPLIVSNDQGYTFLDIEDVK